MRHLILPALLALLGVPALADGATAVELDAASATRLRLFVNAYDVVEGAPVDSATANTILATRMGRLGEVFTFVTREDVQQVLNHEALKQLIGAEDDASSLIQLGETIQADRLVHGRMAPVGKTYVATLTLYDLRTGAVEKRVAGTFRGAQDLAITRLNEQADQLLAHLLQSYAPDKVKKNRRVAIRMGKRTPPPPAWTWLDATGAGLTGLGVGLAAGAGAMHGLAGDSVDLVVPVSLYATGGVLAATGVVLMAWPDGD